MIMGLRISMPLRSVWGTFGSKSTSTLSKRHYSRTKPREVQNRIYDPVRQPSELETYLLLSSSSNTPLITLWTAIWCPSCKQISPLIQQLIKDAQPSSSGDLTSGALNYVEVDLSSPLIGDLGTQYGISSMPTLLSFSKGEPQVETKVTRLEDMKSREFVQRWLDEERKRGGKGGAGGGWFFR